jgi:L-ribulokinase
MQIYADVTGREIYLSGTAQACAYGSAVLGAVGERGYATLREAANALRKVKDAHYTPDAVAHERYAELYAQYKKIGEYFAVSERDMMTVLKEKK